MLSTDFAAVEFVFAARFTSPYCAALQAAWDIHPSDPFPVEFGVRGYFCPHQVFFSGGVEIPRSWSVRGSQECPARRPSGA
jgi:hypothetical protein